MDSPFLQSKLHYIKSKIKRQATLLGEDIYNIYKWQRSIICQKLQNQLSKIGLRLYSSIKCLAANAEDMSLTLVQEDSTRLGASKPMHHDY